MSEIRNSAEIDLPRGKIGVHRIEIAASAAQVWSLIEDVAGWTEWNPIYREAAGSLRPGETLRLLVEIPGLKPQQIAVPVVKLHSGSHLQYGGPSLGGLIRTMRFVDVQPLSSDRCVVRNGEVMGGLVGRALGPFIGPKILEALRQMNQGLKAAAEAGRETSP